jgi:uncharacterized protein (DUF608 family)
MRRRELLGSLLLTAAARFCERQPPRSLASTFQNSKELSRLFTTDLPALKWLEFAAAGFSHPVSGLIYRLKQPPRQGMALGAIDTGYISLETDATFGFCTLFNSICPQRGPLKWPFLGMSLDSQVWLLSSPMTSFGEYMFTGVQTPADIHYWGHFPVVDLEYEMPGSPVSVGLRAWAPFLPGDSVVSNTPGAVFDVHLRNNSGAPQVGRLAFTFPGPTQAEAQVSSHSPRKKRVAPYVEWVAVAPEPTRALREKVRGNFSGLVVTSEAVRNIGYAIGVAGEAEVQVGAALSGKNMPYTSGRAWHEIGSSLPSPEGEDFGGSVSVGFNLESGERKVVSFVLAWFAPMWIGNGPHTFMHMYATRFKSALDVAQFLSKQHNSLLNRVLAWQEVIYAERQLPNWLRDSLINILYLFPVNSLWAAARPPIGPWCRPEDGLFGMIDGIVEDPAVEPMPDTFYANAPIVYFFPDLALSTMRGYKAYQFTNGAAPWIFGGVVGEANGGYAATAGPEMAMPTPGYQATTTGPSYVDMVDRYLMRTGSDAVLHEFYPSVKQNTIYTMNLRKGDGAADIISVPTGDVDPYRPNAQPGYHLEWFEGILWFGMTAHVGGIHLANLEMAERMARKVGDASFADQCRRWFEEGSRAMETEMWAGKYYLAYYEPKTGRKSDDIFAYQLDGDWMARFHGLPDVFRKTRVMMTLKTIERTCVPLTPYGAVNMARPDGKLAEGVGYGPNAFFVPEVYMLAMTYMYAGERDFGLELARRCVQAVTLESGSEWNQPNIVRGDNGLPLFGSHYDQNMMLWALPAAIVGESLDAPCRPGGLVERVCTAARNGRRLDND